jgi:tetratricopeptide (TPR) repeat protein
MKKTQEIKLVKPTNKVALRKVVEEFAQKEKQRQAPTDAKPEPEPDNYWTWLTSGDDHMKFGEYQPALDCYEKSLVALRENPPPWDKEDERRGVLRVRARALSRLNRHDEALRAFDEVMELEQVPVTGELTLWQADCLMNYALALTNAGRRDEGMACYQRALTTYRREWASGSESGGKSTALTLCNIGVWYVGMFDFATALQKYDESLELHRAVDAKHGGEPSVAAALVLSAKSRALVRIDRYDEALTAAREAVRILEPEVSKFGGEPVKLDLSLALLRQGKALDRLYCATEASACYKRSTELAHEVKRRRGTLQNTDES